MIVMVVMVVVMSISMMHLHFDFLEGVGYDVDVEVSNQDTNGQKYPHGGNFLEVLVSGHFGVLQKEVDDEIGQEEE